MKTDGDRLLSFIEKIGMNPKKFGHALGMDRVSIIYNIVNNKTNISKTVLVAIAKNFSQLNIGWLITGVGSMLILGDGDCEQCENENAQLKDQILVYNRVIKDQINTIEELKTKLK